MGIVHRDLKPENLLLDHEKNIKLVDFGLSNTYKQGCLLKTACGSPCYAAPEMIAGQEYHGSRVDVWSCGVILYAMICGYLPFEDPDTTSLYKKILKGDFALPQHVSKEGSEMLSNVLNTDPETRFTEAQIRQHRWFKLHQPICKNEGLIIGKNSIPAEPKILQVIEQFGFKPDYAEKCINNNKHNQVTTIYYLMHKRYQKQGLLQSHFTAQQHIDEATKQEEKLAEESITEQVERALKEDHPPVLAKEDTLSLLIAETKSQPSSKGSSFKNSESPDS